MKKTLKILLIVGVSLLIAGVTVFGISFVAAGGNFGALGNREVKMHTYVENTENPVSSVTIDFKNAAVTVSVEEDIQTLSVEYPQLVNKDGEPLTEISVKETNGGVTLIEKKLWKAYISAFDFTAPGVTLHLPKDRTYALNISTDNGDIALQGAPLQANVLTLDTDNGNVALGDLTCEKLTVDTDNGSISVKNTTVRDTAVLETDNGKIQIQGTLFASSLKIDTDNGKIEGGEGRISAKHTHIETDTGDITLTIEGKREDYTVTLEQDVGKANIQSGGSGAKTLELSTDVGNIDIRFQE